MARVKVCSSSEAQRLQDFASERCSMPYRAPELFNVESYCMVDERTDIWVKSDCITSNERFTWQVPFHLDCPILLHSWHFHIAFGVRVSDGFILQVIYPFFGYYELPDVPSGYIKLSLLYWLVSLQTMTLFHDVIIAEHHWLIDWFIHSFIHSFILILQMECDIIWKVFLCMSF